MCNVSGDVKLWVKRNYTNHVCVRENTCRGERTNLQEIFSSFHYVGPGVRTQVTRLGSSYPLSQLSSPKGKYMLILTGILRPEPFLPWNWSLWAASACLAAGSLLTGRAERQ